jgi:hypothetical protein
LKGLQSSNNAQTTQRVRPSRTLRPLFGHQCETFCGERCPSVPHILIPAEQHSGSLHERHSVAAAPAAAPAEGAPDVVAAPDMVAARATPMLRVTAPAHWR